MNNKTAVGTQVIGEIPGVDISGGNTYQPQNRVDFDITEYALAEHEKGNKTIAVHLSQNKRASGGDFANFASKENEDELKHPKLTILAYTKL